MKTKFLKLFFVILTTIIIFSCSNAFQNMEKCYDNGQFLEAANYAIQGLKNPDTKAQVLSYMKTNGTKIIEKAIFVGDRMSVNVSSEKNIYYYSALLQILEKMVLLEMPVDNLSGYITEVQEKLNKTIDSFCQTQYDLGRKAFDNKIYRKSAEHFSLIIKYLPLYKDASTYLTQAEKKSFRQISISPLYKPSNIFTQALSDTIANIITSGLSNGGIIKENIVISGVNLSESLNSKLLYELNRNKTKYLTFSMDDETANINHTNYYVDGIFNSYENVNSYIKKNSEGKTYLALDYKIKIDVKATLFLTTTNKEVKTITFQESAQTTFSFPDEKEGYYPKNTTIEMALSRAAAHLSSEILETIDKDMDPVTYQE